MIRKEYRDDSPDSVGYIEDDHPLRPSMAAQSVRLLQAPPNEDDHNAYSFTASFTDMDVPIFTRETAFERDRQYVSGFTIFNLMKCNFLISYYEYKIMDSYFPLVSSRPSRPIATLRRFYSGLFDYASVPLFWAALAFIRMHNPATSC